MQAETMKVQFERGVERNKSPRNNGLYSTSGLCSDLGIRKKMSSSIRVGTSTPQKRFHKSLNFQSKI